MTPPPSPPPPPADEPLGGASSHDPSAEGGSSAEGSPGGPDLTGGSPRSAVAQATSDRPTSPAEPWSRTLTWVTGLFLVVLLPLHVALVVVHDDVGATTVATVSARWADPMVQGLEWVTLVLALVHATLSLRAAVDRSRLAPPWRRGVGAGVTTLAVLLGLGATWTMLTFS